MVISKNGNNYNAVLTVDEAPAVASSPTQTETATATKSSGASGSETGTHTQTESPSHSPAVSSPSPSQSAVPATAIANTGTGSGVTVITSGANAYNLLAVGLGCTFGGALAVATIVMVVRQAKPKKIFNQPPTIIRVSPLQEVNPYMV
jgi:hypothetical protein